MTQRGITAGPDPLRSAANPLNPAPGQGVGRLCDPRLCQGAAAGRAAAGRAAEGASGGGAEIARWSAQPIGPPGRLTGVNAFNLSRPDKTTSRDLLLRLAMAGVAVTAIMGLLPLLLELAA